jgi:hypothetical protein
VPTYITRHTPRLRAAAIAATSALAFAATAATAGAAGAQAKAPARAHAASTTIHVIEHAITDTENPGVKGADVKGNILTFNNPVYNTANKTKVGHDEGFCVRVQPQQKIWECLWTTFLKGGQLTVQGPYYDNRNSILTITGGTGIYDGARGEMNLNAKDGGKEYDFIFHLL